MNKELKIAILNDETELIKEYIDWTVIETTASVSFFTDQIEKEALINGLYNIRAICIMSENIPITKEILTRLPYLDLIICQRTDAAFIDLAVCKELNIEVKVADDLEVGMILKTWVEEQFDLDPKITEIYHQDGAEIYGILKSKSVVHLYHANTLSTSQTFIEEGALLSRHYVQQHGLIQTDQASDDKDNRFGVWDDIFVDGVDNHFQHKKPNSYGPVLFLLRPELLLELEENPLLVTRFNPHYWESIPTWKRRYIKDSIELEKDYKSYKNDSSRMMFTIRSCGKHILLSKYLAEIIIDKSNFKVKTNEGSVSMELFLYNKLRSSLDENGLAHIPIHYRHTPPEKYNCHCLYLYDELKEKEAEELKKRIKPKSENM